MDCEKIYESIKQKTRKDSNDNVAFFHSLIRELKVCFDNEENLINNIIICKTLIHHIKACENDFMQEMTTAELIYILECFSENKISYSNIEPEKNDVK